MFKRTVSLLTALVLLLFCFANASAEGFTDPVHQIEMKSGRNNMEIIK